MPHDGSGTGWNENSPANAHFVKDGAQEIRDLRRGARIRLNKEHEALAASSAGGEHKAGSARAFSSGSAPTNRPDGATPLGANDSGRLWFQEGAKAAHVYDGSAFVPIVPTGAVLPYGGTTAPGGWLLCNGQAVSRTTQATLFAVIGTTYGDGDGTTTFNLPDLSGRFPLGAGNGHSRGDEGGAEAHELTTEEMPTHNHRLWSDNGSSANANGLGNANGFSIAAKSDDDGSGYKDTLAGSSEQAVEDAGDGDPHNNMPPFSVFNYIIKT